MLRSLHIKNYLLIPEIEIEFDPGMTVITGETGAGKSLVVDSLKYAFGERTNSAIVRDGCDMAQITVMFETNNPRTVEFLQSYDLHAGSTCTIRREIYRQKPTRVYVNGTSASLQTLRELGTTLVDIHGQHEHHMLLKPITQRGIFDGFAGNSDDLNGLADHSRQVHKAESGKAEAKQLRSSYEQHLELLRDQYEVFDQLTPQKGEFSSLRERLLQLSHSEELSSTLGEVSLGLFYSDDSTVSGTLGEYARQLQRLSDFDSGIQSHTELLDEARFRVDDVARELRSLADRIEHNPGDIEEIEQRMGTLQRLARVHDVDADELPAAMDALQSKIESYEKRLDEIAQLDSNIEQYKLEYRTVAARVSDRRKSAKDQFEQLITSQMQNLGMEGGVFEIGFSPTDPERFESYGDESARFLVSTTPGQAVGALSDVASGGELSRLSLAIQVTNLDSTKVPTIVFDEVDVGIGGRVAERVGQLLQALGQSVQIICITHLPQVAAQGHQQINVSKTTQDTSTVEVHLLDREQRVNEIARMLGGAKITGRAIEHAKEMLEQGKIDVCR
ncbi:MAG: DNA repair protein RecN [Acidiferrobacterales bacterium]|nr:DNA repair protein RecN [Acidiferrobacterales bacterium]